MFVESEEMKFAVDFRIKETLTDFVRTPTWELRRVLCKKFLNKFWRHISETWYLMQPNYAWAPDANACTSIWWANLPTLFARGSYNDNDSLESNAIRKPSLSRAACKTAFPSKSETLKRQQKISFSQSSHHPPSLSSHYLWLSTAEALLKEISTRMMERFLKATL